MKNLFKNLITVAVAAIAITGCSKDPENLAPEAKGFTLNLIADNQTAGISRTEYDPAISNIKWTSGDEAAFYINSINQTSSATVDETNKATFKLSNLTIETTNIQGYYPSSAFWSDGGNKIAEKKVTAYAMTLPDVQHANTSSFDPLADILIARNNDNVEVTEATKDVAIQFGRPVAVSKFTFAVNNATLTASSETIEAVEFKVASGDKFLAGNFYFNPETGYYVMQDGTTPVTDHTTNAFAGNPSNKVLVTLTDKPAANADFNAWFVTAPVTIKAGDVLEFTLTTNEGKIITKTATVSNDLVFTNNKLNKLTINLDDQVSIVQMERATLTRTEIAASTGETAYGKEKTVTNSFGIWKTNGYKLAKTSNFFQLKKKDGDFSIDIPELAGSIRAIQLNVSNASATQPGGNSTTLGFRENWSTGILSTGTGSSEVMLVNPSDCKLRSGSVCATDGAVRIYDITVYYLPSTDPYINAEDINATAAANDNGESSYTLGNTTETAVTAVCDGTVVTTALAEDGLIMYEISGNYGTEVREGWIELALTNDASVAKRIAVTQAGSTFTVPEKISILNNQTSVKFTVNSSDFGWTITSPEGITVSPLTGVAGDTEVTVTADASNTGTDPLALGSLSILRTGDIAANAQTITVEKLPAGSGTTVTIDSFSSVNGNIDEHISYASYKGGGTTNPAVQSNAIRLYQGSGTKGGGYIEITAAAGYKIQSITIGTTNSYSTTVKHQVDGGELSAGQSVPKNGTYSVDGLTAQKVSFHCYGTSKTTRLEIGSIEVTYVTE